MVRQQPGTQTMKASEARQQFASVLNRVYRKETRIVVEKSGIPVAAIVSADDLRRLDEFDRDRERRFAIIDEVREAFRGVPPEEIERETDRILAEIRAENAQERSEAAATR